MCDGPEEDQEDAEGDCEEGCEAVGGVMVGAVVWRGTGGVVY